MTMVFSVASMNFIVMANDSAVVYDFDDGHREYDTGRKFFVADQVGCVTMWGARDGNQLVQHLSSLQLNPTRDSVETLAHHVNRYLTEQYAPHEGPLGDTGFHVGGFTKDGVPLLNHIFWNVPDSAQGTNTRGAYSLQYHQPIHENEIRFLYNGRNDLASTIINHFIRELNEKAETKFPSTAVGMCRLAHFILRFGYELTPEVGPPFFLHVIAPDRRCLTIQVDMLCPVEDEYFKDKMASLKLV